MLCSGMATLECNFFIPISFITVRQFQSESTGSLVSFIRFFSIVSFHFCRRYYSNMQISNPHLNIFRANCHFEWATVALKFPIEKRNFESIFFVLFFFALKILNMTPLPVKDRGEEEGEWVYSIKRKIRNGPPFDALLKFA